MFKSMKTYQFIIHIIELIYYYFITIIIFNDNNKMINEIWPNL